MAIFGCSVKTRASFAFVVVSVPTDLAMIHRHEISHKLQESRFLLLSPGVSSVAVLVSSTYITHANAMTVVTLTVCTYPGYRPTAFNRSIQVHYVMVAYVCPSSSTWWRQSVPELNVFGSVISSPWGVATVYYNLVNVSWHDSTAGWGGDADQQPVR